MTPNETMTKTLLDLVENWRNNDLVSAQTNMAIYNGIVDENMNNYGVAGIFNPYSGIGVNQTLYYILENIKGITDRKQILWNAKLSELELSGDTTVALNFVQSYIDNKDSLANLNMKQISDIIRTCIKFQLYPQLAQLRTLYQ